MCFFLLVPRTNFVLPFFICINSSPRKKIKFLYVLLLSNNPEQLFHFLKLTVDKSPFKLLSEEHAVSESCSVHTTVIFCSVFQVRPPSGTRREAQVPGLAVA